MGEQVEKKNEGEKAAAEGVEKAAAGGGGERKEAPTAVVLKMDLHCQGCAKKVRRSISNLPGVEKVTADFDAKILTVTGNVDPTWLREKVELKTMKKVELISPQPKSGGGGADDKKAEDDTNKPRKAVVSTATMKTKLHCDGCAHKIKRIIIKNFDGVDSLTTDLQKDLIIVIGTMNVNDLVTYLREKLKRGVEIVPPNKNDSAPIAEKKAAEGAVVEGKEKKPNGGGDGKEEEKKGKESDVTAESGEKKKEGGGGKKEGEPKPAAEPAGEAGGGGETKVETSKMEYHNSYNPQTYYAMPMVMHGHQDYGMHHYQSRADMGYYMAGPPLPPPTYVSADANNNMFSDENPNGCSVM
ncbi:heavy metal-associated isoprenylated plant protein 6-like [Salvia divinorum]|uniref:Heavy metal-associated isoprenylated plant protein 6-like n=1 Tax=Salvia divinorum TaxID=28513 RepID=A0ABD1IC87_SALDI